MNFKRFVFYSVLFVFSFILFFYISFPYTMLKEAALSEAMKQTGYDIRVRSMKPKLPLGFELEGIQVNLPSGEKGIELKAASINIGVLQLFLLKAALFVELDGLNKGHLDSQVSFAILSAINGHFIPSFIKLDSDNFPIGHLARFGMAQGQMALKDQALLADLISKFGVNGRLFGGLELNLDSSNPKASKGKMDLQIKQGVLKIDRSLGMADQNFEKALLNARLRNGRLKFDDRSGFHTQGLKIDVSGAMTLKNQLDKSSMNVDLKVRLDKDLKDQYGFVIDTALGGSGGSLKCQIRGTLGHPNVVTL